MTKKFHTKNHRKDEVFMEVSFGLIEMVEMVKFEISENHHSPLSSAKFGANGVVKMLSGNSRRYSLTKLDTTSGSQSLRFTWFPKKVKRIRHSFVSKHKKRQLPYCLD